jgi:hypothetical protein
MGTSDRDKGGRGHGVLFRNRVRCAVGGHGLRGRGHLLSAAFSAMALVVPVIGVGFAAVGAALGIISVPVVAVAAGLVALGGALWALWHFLPHGDKHKTITLSQGPLRIPSTYAAHSKPITHSTYTGPVPNSYGSHSRPIMHIGVHIDGKKVASVVSGHHGNAAAGPSTGSSRQDRRISPLQPAHASFR